MWFLYPVLPRFSLYRHSREGGNPLIRSHGGLKWIPAFAGMTAKNSICDCPALGGSDLGVMGEMPQG
jgi:hypothetical protein